MNEAIERSRQARVLLHEAERIFHDVIRLQSAGAAPGEVEARFQQWRETRQRAEEAMRG